MARRGAIPDVEDREGPVQREVPLKYVALIAALTACLLARVALAEDVVPQVVMTPQQSQVPGRAIDIRGLVPGMTLDQARSSLEAVFGFELNEMRERTALREAGVTVTSIPFVKMLSGADETESMMAMFTGIGSGNQVMYVDRTAEYDEIAAAPLFDPFLASIVEKYGEPTQRRDRMDVTSLIWTFKDGQLVHCEYSAVPQCLPPQSAISNVRDSSEFFDVIVFAQATRSRTDRERVEAFNVSSIDLSIVAEAEAADEAGLRAVLGAAVDASRADAVTPVL